MAITRAQQAKQMLQDGGRIGLKGGADAATASFAKSAGFGKSTAKADPEGGFDLGGGQGPTFGGVQATQTTGDQGKKAKENYEKQFFDKGQVPPLGSRPTSFKQRLDQRNKQKRLNYINYLQRQINKKLQAGLMDPSIPGVDVMTEEELLDLAPSVQDLVAKGFYSKDGPFAKGEKIPDFPSTDLPGTLGIAQDIFAGPVTSDKLEQLNQQIKDLEALKTTEGLEGTTFNELMETYEPNRFKLMNPEPGGDGPQDPCKGPNPPAYCFIGENADDNMEAAVTRNLSGLSPRIGGSMFNFTGMADGGIADMDREAFLLGGIAKGLKKAVRGVKKLVKSPIGKAALLGAVGFGIPGTQFGGIFGKGAFSKFIGQKAMTQAPFAGGTGLKGILESALGFAKANPFKTIGGVSLLSGLMTPKEDENDELAKYLASQKLDPSLSIKGMGSDFDFDFYGAKTQPVADGGRIGYQEGSKEPVAKKTMPLLDMGGMEKDYRETGGFVDMGRMERADDVPARLSKNEFVFTADAVRNAGEGDIDKGAEVMYNMMKNLEAGGEVSEESQGLEGARKMFQTSQRLGEVI